jgi:CHAT domain-containing protein/tetratricopeptide (TPR) repeat protein
VATLALGALVGAVGADPDPPSALEPGQVVQRAIAGKQEHTYVLRLERDELARVRVRPRNQDVAVVVTAPGGEVLADVDNAGENGVEVVPLVAATAGLHSVTVRPSLADAPPGDYQAVCEERRPAGPEDRERWAALRARSRGRRLRDSYSSASLREAVGLFDDAIARWRALGDREEEAGTLEQRGLALGTLGEMDVALASLEDALHVYRQIGDRRGEAQVIQDIGAMHYQTGDQQEALRRYEEALAVQRELGLVRAAAETLNNMTAAYNWAGDPQRALETGTEALAMVRATGDRWVESTLLTNLSSAERRLGNAHGALAHAEAAMVVARGLDSPWDVASAWSVLGEAQAVLGRLAEAEASLERAQATFRAQGLRRAQANTLRAKADVYLAAGDAERALECLREALALSRAIADPAIEAAVQLRIARGERSRDRLEDALAAAQAGIEIVESIRSRFVSRQLRAQYSSSVHDLFETKADVLMRLHERSPGKGLDGQALAVAEKGRARGLAEVLGDDGVRAPQEVGSELARRERDLRDRFRARGRLLTRVQTQANPETDVAAALERELAGIAREHDEVQARIRALSPAYAGLTQAMALGPDEIQRGVLDEGSLLLEYLLGEPRSYLWVVTPTSLESHVLPSRGVIEAASRRLHDAWAHRPTDDPASSRAAQELSQMVLGPAVAALRARRLLVVADGALQYVPFAALPVGGEPLVASHEVVTLPSASVVPLIRHDRPRPSRDARVALVLADPVFAREDPRVPGAAAAPPTAGPAADWEVELTRSATGVGLLAGGAIPRLPFSRREALTVGRLVPRGSARIALDFDARREVALGEEAGDYRIVHFATHAVLNSTVPELSGLVLSLVDREGRRRDGFLRLHDVYALRLSADLVVLSACQTALGKEVRGEGVVGLTRGFMYAGAPRVVASLWRVDDRATSELMKVFYEGMLGPRRLRAAAALRAAQDHLRTRTRWRAPYFWAGFVLHGEWR